MKEEAKAAVEPDVLQDRVFVAALIRVLTDVFGSAKDLYHRLKQKSGSDDESQHGATRERRDSHAHIIDSLGHHVRWNLDRRPTHHSDTEDDLVCSASAQVQTTYDRAYRKLGESYARGDDIAKMQLQSHIIKLQQVLISIHQDLTLSSYLTIASSHSQLIRLVQTIRTTRAAAIQALDLQYQRMLAGPPPKPPAPHPSLPGSYPAPPRPHRSRSSSSSSSSASSHAPSKPTPKPTPKPNPTLFCPYALTLQHSPTHPLSPAFSPSGTRLCPHCRTLIPVRPGKAWEVIMSSGRHAPRRRFLVRNAFVVKCHRAGGGFACVVCARLCEVDTVCGSVAALVEHLWREHTAGEVEGDGDVVGC